jgi:hypothetical protein
MSTGTLFNFIKDPSTNSLKYTGPGARFHIIVTFNFFEGNQNTCGFYIGHNTDDTTPLDPNADRISESEIYINSSNPSSQPIGGAIQTVLDLNTDDRVFFIVQNKEAASDITVEFMKFTVTSITAERGPQGFQGATGSIGINSIGANIGSGQSVIPVGSIGYIRITKDCTITSWSIISEISGSIAIDVWRLSNNIPTVVDSIIGAGTKPFLSSERVRVGTPTGWTSTALLTGDVIAFRVDSASFVTKAVVQINT